MEKYDVIIYGCGVMGRKTAYALLRKASLDVVGALDIEPELVGRDLAEVLDNPEKLGIPLEKDPVPFFLELC